MAEEFVDKSYKTGGELRKRQAWSSWAIKHFGEMKLAKVAGLFPKREGWRNVVEHSLVANGVAVYLARKIEAAGNPINVELTDTASILHDIAKRSDTENRISRNDEITAGSTHQLLELGNYSPELIQAAEYSARVPEIYLSDEEQEAAINAKPVEDLIVAYADARVRNTAIVSLEEAQDKNKIKVPADAAFYDKWFSFYKRVEDKLCTLANIDPSEISDGNVYAMISNQG